ncbi:MAG: glycosyltransferase [Candidatus Peregrinibacteria bacterium]
MKTILLISPYWKEDHRWMASSVKLAELWQKLGYRVVVACMGKPALSCQPLALRLRSGRAVSNPERVSETLTIYRKKDFFLPDPWNYGIAFGFSSMVRNIIEQEKPEIIVVNKILFWSSLSIIALRLRGVRVLLMTDTLVGMTWWPRGLLPRIGAFLYAWTLGWLILLLAKRVVFFHPQLEKLLKRLGIEKKSVVIPTGIDAAHWPVGVREQGRDDLTVTYVGRLESVKGVSDFLAASTSLLPEYPNLCLQVAGWFRPDHPLVSQYQDHVRFLGLVSDIGPLIRKTDIFVLPSYSEGLSNALMEAMASGCACIASDTGGNRFLIKNGVSGFLFPPGDREALTAHIRRLIADSAKRRALGEGARRRIEEKFDWKIVGEQYRSLFREFLLQSSL